jgi:transposase InsO family protein
VAILSQVRYETIYLAIRDLHDTKSYPIKELCEIIGIQRSSYYKWLNRKESDNEKFNKELLPIIKEAYEERNGILGYRQMTIKLNREHYLHVNHKRIYRLMNILNLKSVCRRKRKNYIKSTPEITAENVLNRAFESNEFGTKWLTDVSRCIDNGPIEAFWGMMKSEMYYLNKFDTYEELGVAIVEYIDYYNSHRYQRRLNCMTPLEYRQFLNGSVA